MKKIIKTINESIRPPLLVLLMVFITGHSIGQVGAPFNSKFSSIAKPGSSRDWVDFSEGTVIKPTTIFEDFKDAFELSNDDQMKIKKTENDELGFTHYRYQQYYKNLPVLYGEYYVHQQHDGFVNAANGRLISGLNLNSTASVTEKQALGTALHFMNAKKYLWQNDELEKGLKQQNHDQSATYYPKGKLVFAPRNNDPVYEGQNYRLAWQFEVYTEDAAVPAKSVCVDALTNEVIHYNDISMSCSPGSGATAFNGNQTIYTQFTEGTYRSHNDCQATDIYVYNCNGGGASNTFYTDADNIWNNPSAVQCQWGAKKTYDYYLGQHSRTSWNNAAGDMIAYNNANAGQNNACWGCTGNSTIFYAGNTPAATDDWNTIDIVGHEFTHGVTQASAGLVYSNESGALNESFSDIFGEMVQSWSTGTCDYLVGADRGAIRSFINPNAYNNPGTYHGTYWYTGVADHGGVHTNSGVQNHWFYLLSEGGSGTNEFGTHYNVTGITRFKARLIAYRALTMYLNSSSQYIDARKATLRAAWDLYGQCSPEIIAVGDAWHAVGVESQSPPFTRNICGFYPFSGTFMQAISTLTAANGCTTEITPSATTVYFTARDRVILYPGFRADDGSHFVAYLEPCSSTMWRTGSPSSNIIMSDEEKGIKNQKSYSKESVKVPDNIIADKISVAPNPFTSSFELSIHSDQDVKAQVFIYSPLGIKVKQKDGINLSKGLNKISFDCPNLEKGVYMVEINMGDVKTVKRIVKM